MKSLILKFFILFFIPAILYGQDPIPAKERRLHFYLGTSMITQKSDYTVEGSNLPSPGYVYYPSIDISLSLKARRPMGWNIEYSNPLIGESLTNAIFHLTGIIDKETYLMEHTISSGLFGRIDFGKNLVSGKNNRLNAGFVISDKFISGIYFLPSASSSDDYRSPNAEGYFIAPGIYAEITHTTPKDRQLSVNTSFTQSVLNLWDVNSDIDYKNHLFNETNLKILTKNGWYYKAGTIIVIPFTDLSPKFRLSLTIGHRIF
jgi:hypothetical protein